MLKELTATEKVWYPGRLNTGFLLRATQHVLDMEQQRLYDLEDNKYLRPILYYSIFVFEVLAGVAEQTGRTSGRAGLPALVPGLQPSPLPLLVADLFPHSLLLLCRFGRPDPRNGDLAAILAEVARARGVGRHPAPSLDERLFPISWLPVR